MFVVLGDGELQEGSNWEAAMCAGHRQLDNLTAIVDRNRLQQGARTEDTNRLEPLAGQVARLRLGDRSNATATTMRRSMSASTAPRDGRPRCVIAKHDQGQGRFVHRGPRRVAPQGSLARAGRDSRCRSLPDGRPVTAAGLFDCRQAFAETLIELARQDRAHRRGLQRQRRLEQPRRLPEEIPRAARSMSASPSRTWWASPRASPTAASFRSSAPPRRS